MKRTIILAYPMAFIFSGAMCGDRVTVVIDGQRVVITNGEEIIRKHGEQKGMDIIYDRAKMILKHGGKEGRVIQ